MSWSYKHMPCPNGLSNSMWRNVWRMSFYSKCPPLRTLIQSIKTLSQILNIKKPRWLWKTLIMRWKSQLQRPRIVLSADIDRHVAKKKGLVTREICVWTASSSTLDPVIKRTKEDTLSTMPSIRTEACFQVAGAQKPPQHITVMCLRVKTAAAKVL